MLNNLKIVVDKRTTLLGIVEILSNYSHKYPRLMMEYGNKNYIEEVKMEFDDFRNHEIIDKFNKLIEKYDFSFSKPIQLFLELDEELMFSEEESHPFCLKYNNDIQIIDFLKSVYLFSQEIDFEKFYRRQNNRFSKYIENVLFQLNNDNKIIDFLQEYYGVILNKKLVVNLIPWRTYGCYGTQTKSCIYTHICCHHLSKSDLDIYPKESEKFNFESFLVHEFSHSIINPIVDQNPIGYIDEQEIFQNTTKLHKMGYGSNTSILKDYLVRGITQRYLKLTNNKYYQNQCKDDELLGFTEMTKFIYLLEEYEKNRSKYLNFNDYYQTAITYFLIGGSSKLK